MLAAVVVSDFASPYCWLVEAALRRLRDEGLVEPRYAALELFPAPAPLEAAPAVEPARPLAGELGLELQAPTRPVRTRKAHELARLAREQGREDEVREAIFAAYFAEDRDIGRIDVLVEVARAAGMDPTEARVVLDVDRFTAAVTAESVGAREAGLVSVPVVVLGTGPARLRVDGAFPLEEWRRVVEEVVRSTQSEG